MAFCNTVCVGAFGPLLPEIGRAQGLADWELGILAGSFGFARMAADVPTGWLAGRRLGTTLALAPAVLLAGLLLLGGGGPGSSWAVGFGSAEYLRVRRDVRHPGRARRGGPAAGRVELECLAARRLLAAARHPAAGAALPPALPR